MRTHEEEETQALVGDKGNVVVCSSWNRWQIISLSDALQVEFYRSPPAGVNLSSDIMWLSLKYVTRRLYRRSSSRDLER